MEGHERTLQRYLKPDLLIIDVMGMKQLPKRSGEYLFEIIMRRHELKSTMMTSNRPLEDWGKLIEDVPSATAILDRFLHRSGQAGHASHKNVLPDALTGVIMSLPAIQERTSNYDESGNQPSSRSLNHSQKTSG